jgi:single-strand DNA-binding protein
MLNHIVLQGRLCNDPDLRYTPAQVPTASFTLAVDRDYSGNGERKTDFIDVVAWRKTAEFVSRYFQKGSAAVVSGRLQVRDWKDRDGNTRRAVEVNADSVYFGESRRASSLPLEGKVPSEREADEVVPPAHSFPAASRPVDVAPPFEDLGEDDDGTLPF